MDQMELSQLLVRLALLEQRMDRMQSDMNLLSTKIEASVDQLEAIVTDMKSQPNPVMQFINSHWKGIIVVIAALAGVNATAIEVLGKVLGG